MLYFYKISSRYVLSSASSHFKTYNFGIVEKIATAMIFHFFTVPSPLLLNFDVKTVSNLTSVGEDPIILFGKDLFIQIYYTALYQTFPPPSCCFLVIGKRKVIKLLNLVSFIKSPIHFSIIRN